MITTITDFDRYFSNNYGGFVRFVINLQKQIRKEAHQTLQYDCKDIVNDCYLKIREKIHPTGFTGNISGYTMITIKNTVITEKNNGTKFLSLDMHCNINEDAEKQLREQNANHISSQIYGDNLRQTSEKVFRYISTRYSEKELFIFRHYYLNKKQTYRKVQKATGLSMGFISETIKKMKQDLRENQQLWI